MGWLCAFDTCPLVSHKLMLVLSCARPGQARHDVAEAQRPCVFTQVEPDGVDAAVGLGGQDCHCVGLQDGRRHTAVSLPHRTHTRRRLVTLRALSPHLTSPPQARLQPAAPRLLPPGHVCKARDCVHVQLSCSAMRLPHAASAHKAPHTTTSSSSSSSSSSSTISSGGVWWRIMCILRHCLAALPEICRRLGREVMC